MVSHGWKRQGQPATHGGVAEVNILITHPSAELYGSDRMALLTLRALVKRGHAVTAVVPADGPLLGQDARIPGERHRRRHTCTA